MNIHGRTLLLFMIRRVRNYIYYKRKQHIKLGKGKKILYIGIPIHNNMGDQAQKYCIRKWIDDNYPGYQLIEFPARNIYDERFSIIERLKKHLTKDDIIIFQSGYNVHDLDMGETLAKQIVLETFSNQVIVIMPQTVYFRDSGRKKEVAESFSRAKRLLFITRDRISFDIAKGMLPEKKVLLYPDIVTSLIGQYKVNSERSGIYMCLRQDVEKYYSDKDLSILKDKLCQIDNVDEGDTSIKCDPYWLDRHVKQELDKLIEKYGKYKLIVTDRFHGTIFSIIAGTPVIVIKTKDHKVSTGVEWFNGVYENVYFAENLDDVIGIANNIANNNIIHQPMPYFYEKYYAHLKDEVDQLFVQEIE